MKAGLWDYIKAAFNARPMGMFVAPNWAGVAAFAMLGVLNPGFWAVGAGLELAYLYALSTNKRFQRYVAGTEMQEEQQQSRTKLQTTLAQLGEAEQARYHALERRCQAILQHQHPGADAAGDLQPRGEGLGKLLWIYLRLLNSRQAFARLMQEAMRADRAGEPLGRRIQRLQLQLAEPSVGEELRKSLTSQIEILQQRVATQREAMEKLAFLDAEITRIEEQVELIREQAVLTTDPAAVSERIDQIAATLAGTNQWMRDQQQAYGEVEDVLEDPPPLIVQPAGRQAQ